MRLAVCLDGWFSDELIKIKGWHYIFNRQKLKKGVGKAALRRELKMLLPHKMSALYVEFLHKLQVAACLHAHPSHKTNELKEYTSRAHTRVRKVKGAASPKR